MSTAFPVKKRRNRTPNKKRFSVEVSYSPVYKLTKFESDGWADAEMYKPIPYDLILLETSEGKLKSGWWAEFNWDGRRVEPTDIIVRWKRLMYDWGN
jgi:hypothetical protein